MINTIEFISKIFDNSENENIMTELTDYVIILCDSSNTKAVISDEIESINYAIGPDYENDKSEDSDIRTEKRYLPTSIYNIDGEQKIIVTVEDPFVLTAKTKEDIWFADTNLDGSKIYIYPLTAFAGYKQMSIYEIYTGVLSGVFGSFGRYGR